MWRTCFFALALAFLSPVLCDGLNATVSITEDPHLQTPSGLPFDFEGTLNTAYCFVTDRFFQINALLQGYKDKRQYGNMAPDKNGLKLRTWMTELGFLWVDLTTGKPHSLLLVSRKSSQAARGLGYLALVEIDGQVVKNPYSGSVIGSSGLQLQYTGVKSTPQGEADTFSLSVSGIFFGAFSLQPAIPVLRDPDNAWVHFNFFVYNILFTSHVNGILGQFFPQTTQLARRLAPFWKLYLKTKKPVEASEPSGKGFLLGTVQDYVTPTVTSPKCRFSQFMKGKTAMKEMSNSWQTSFRIFDEIGT